MICTLALATSGIAFATTRTSIHERVGGAQIVSTVDVTIIGAAEIDCGKLESPFVVRQFLFNRSAVIAGCAIRHFSPFPDKAGTSELNVLPCYGVTTPLIVRKRNILERSSFDMMV